MTEMIRNDEEGRLRALHSYDILDTDEEAVFDDFTRLVAHVLDVPIAVISLVDTERQWFKSHYGLDVRETPRDIAFCDKAICEDHIMVVPDARDDDRFKHNPLVTSDPNIRFYAGVPLIADEGHAIGTLCAIDTRPRQLTPEQSEALTIVARQVMARLELRRVTTRAMRAEVERLELEVELQKVQHIEGLAVLAGGIAHDFNNLLSSILGNANLASLALPEESPAKGMIETIEVVSLRAADLTKQLLAYSGSSARDDSVIDLTKLVEEMGHVLEVVISKQVALHFELTAELSTIRGDVTQIRQVIMNLLMNASDAIGARSGVVKVRTGMQAFVKDNVNERYFIDPVAKGEYIFVEVIDTGCGMTRETRARMFDPFYTTKKQGRGFGLAAARGIVRNHGGAIRVYSEEGCGTTIKLLFPSVCATPLSDKESETSHTGSGERILVVDDDEQVRNVAQGILKQFGFRVMSAVDGRDGVECYEANAERIDLVLMDVTMPRMDGIEAFKAIRRLNPEALIVLMSGRGDGMIFNALAGRGVTGFLQKPFSASSVVDEIVTALHPQQASPAGV